MAKKPLKSRRSPLSKTRRSLPKHSLWVLIGALLLSILLHVGSVVQLPEANSDFFNQKQANQPGRVKIKIAEKPKTKKEQEKKADDTKRMVEVPLLKTERPKDPKYLGAQDHKAKKETKVSEKKERPKAADAGNERSTAEGTKEKIEKQLNAKKDGPPQIAQEKNLEKHLTSPNGSVNLKTPDEARRGAYEALLPQGTDLAQQMKQGYQDYIDEKMEEGELIDVDTAEFRYIGYFTTMRKAIELVWVYPTDAARRGMQGSGVLRFTINKDGSVTNVKILQSTGYSSLDNAFVDAVKLASPFAPLPDGFNKDKLHLKFGFRYALRSFAGMN